MDSQSYEHRLLVDNNTYGEFRMPVHGTEAIAVRSISPGTHPLLVDIALGQITLYGPLPAIQERLRTMTEMLDRVLNEPENWSDIRPVQVAPGRWRRLRPHPFHDRPTSPASTPPYDSPQPQTTARAPIIPIRRRPKRAR